MFPIYRFDKPDSDESMVIDHWSYVWAAFTGPLFVLSKGLYLPALAMALATVGIAAGALFGLMLTVYLFNASLEGLTIMLATIVAAFALHAVVAVEIVRFFYLRNGWRLGY